MSSALSLFYDPVWIKKHYEKMPSGLLAECSENMELSWDKVSLAGRVWSAYKRSPNYLRRYLNVGLKGAKKSSIPKEVIEYYNWIYAPLLEINPNLKANLERILFKKSDKHEDKYYWAVTSMHSGGLSVAKEMPYKITYQTDALDTIGQKMEKARKYEYGDAWDIRKSFFAFVVSKGVKIHQGMAAKGVSEILAMPPVVAWDNTIKSIIDNIFISMQSQNQTGWEKIMFINTQGCIPLFIYDFENSIDKFLNWVNNPFM